MGNKDGVSWLPGVPQGGRVDVGVSEADRISLGLASKNGSHFS